MIKKTKAIPMKSRKRSMTEASRLGMKDWWNSSAIPTIKAIHPATKSRVNALKCLCVDALELEGVDALGSLVKSGSIETLVLKLKGKNEKISNIVRMP